MTPDTDIGRALADRGMAWEPNGRRWVFTHGTASVEAWKVVDNWLVWSQFNVPAAGSADAHSIDEGALLASIDLRLTAARALGDAMTKHTTHAEARRIMADFAAHLRGGAAGKRDPSDVEVLRGLLPGCPAVDCGTYAYAPLPSGRPLYVSGGLVSCPDLGLRTYVPPTEAAAAIRDAFDRARYEFEAWASLLKETA